MRSWITLVLALIVSSAFAITVYSPVAVKDPENGFYAGRVSPGHKVTLIVDAGPPSDPWTSVSGDWSPEITVRDGRAWVTLTVPVSEPEGTRTVCIALSGRASEEELCPSFIVQYGLVDLHVLTDVVHADAGFSVNVPLAVVNRSAGSTEVRITCSGATCPERNVSLSPGEIREMNIPVVYPVPGVYTLTLTLKDVRSGDGKEATVVLGVAPGVLSMAKVFSFGVPFSPPVLLPGYLIYSLTGW